MTVKTSLSLAVVTTFYNLTPFINATRTVPFGFHGTKRNREADRHVVFA